MPKKTLSQLMKDKQKKNFPDAVVPDQIISVRHEDYNRLRNVITSQLRRKLAGEFPFNTMGREIEVSTNTFWLEVLSTHAEAYCAHHGHPDDLLDAFIAGVGTHPVAWGRFDTVEQLEQEIDDFMEKHRAN